MINDYEAKLENDNKNLLDNYKYLENEAYYIEEFSKPIELLLDRENKTKITVLGGNPDIAKEKWISKTPAYRAKNILDLVILKILKLFVSILFSIF